MQDFKLNVQGDIEFNDLKQIETVEGLEKLAQDAMFCVKTIKGSDYFQQNFGVDWMRIKKHFSETLLKHEVEKALKRHSKIESLQIRNVVYSKETRQLSFILDVGGKAVEVIL